MDSIKFSLVNNEDEEREEYLSGNDLTVDKERIKLKEVSIIGICLGKCEYK